MRDIFRLTVTSNSRVSAKQVYAVLFLGYFITPFVLPEPFSTGPLIVVLWWIALSWVIKQKLRPYVHGNIRAWQELWIRLSLFLSFLALGALSTSLAFIRPIASHLGIQTNSQALLLQRCLLLVAGIGVIVVIAGGARYFYGVSQLGKSSHMAKKKRKV